MDLDGNVTDNGPPASALPAAGTLDGRKLSADLRDALLKGVADSDPPDHTRFRRPRLLLSCLPFRPDLWWGEIASP